jgi:hypothetical protein
MYSQGRMGVNSAYWLGWVCGASGKDPAELRSATRAGRARLHKQSDQLAFTDFFESSPSK